MPALGRVFRLAGMIDAVARIGSHLRHSIRRDDDGLVAVEIVREFDRRRLIEASIEISQQLTPLSTGGKPHAIDEILLIGRVLRLRRDFDPIPPRRLFRERGELSHISRHFDVRRPEEVQIFAAQIA